jgi:hypothetical protein
MTNWHMIEGGRSNLDDSAYRDFNVVCGANDALSDWAEMVTNTSEDMYGFNLECMASNLASEEFMFDIGIGDSGSEITLINDFVIPSIAGAALYRIGPTIYFPFFIPAGSDIHARGRGSHISEGIGFYSKLRWNIDNPFSAVHVSQCQTMHIDTSISASRIIDPGAIAGTWGSWYDVQDGPLAIDVKWLIICNNPVADVIRSSANWNIQLGVGGAGNEQPILNFATVSHVSSGNITPWVRYFPISIPSGTTLRHRAKCEITSADRYVGISYYLFS